MGSSVKGERLLESLGVREALREGAAAVFAGPVYELRKEPGVHVRLVSVTDDDGRIAVGYARRDDPETWTPVEHEPFTMRALGYYERRLKRIGDRVEARDRRLVKGASQA